MKRKKEKMLKSIQKKNTQIKLEKKIPNQNIKNYKKVLNVQYLEKINNICK